MINRAAVILKYKKPAIKWINDADPVKENPQITAEYVNAERTVYLISDADAETSDAFGRWIEWNYGQLFESELEGWYTDPKLWPKDRSMTVFREWFEIELHTVLVDTVEGPIHDDDV